MEIFNDICRLNTGVGTVSESYCRSIPCSCDFHDIFIYSHRKELYGQSMACRPYNEEHWYSYYLPFQIFLTIFPLSIDWVFLLLYVIEWDSCIFAYYHSVSCISVYKPRPFVTFSGTKLGLGLYINLKKNLTIIFMYKIIKTK